MAPIGIQEDEYHPSPDPLPIYTEALPVPEPLPLLNNHRTLELFHRNEHVILSDPNSDTSLSRNDAGNTSDARTVHSDAIYRINGPDVPNPSNDDAFIITGTATPDTSEQQLRILLAEAVTNVIRHHMEQDLENRNICLNHAGTRELGQITTEAGQQIAEVVQSDDQSEYQTAVDTDSSWNPASNSSVRSLSYWTINSLSFSIRRRKKHPCSLCTTGWYLHP
jgi:hypothetical protein